MYVNSPPVWTAPESGGRQPQIRHEARDPLLLAPQIWWIAGDRLKPTVPEGTVASCSDLTQEPRNLGRVQQVPAIRVVGEQLKHTDPEGTVANCSDLTQAP